MITRLVLFDRLREKLLRSRRLLAVESDGFSLRAAVVSAEGKGVVVERVAESREADLATALAETVGRLRSQDAELPHRAILLTAEAIPAILELPVHPRKPRPAAQMQELIRWELEPHLAQQVSSRPIGSILIGRGYLSYDQTRQVLQELERRKGTAATTSRPSRQFGQVAVEMGFITVAQLQEALAIQERLQVSDEATVCGWSAQPEPSARNGKTFRWLVCGVSRRLRDHLAETFSRQGLHLEGVYPLVGCSAAMLNGATLTATAGVLEVHSGLLGYAGLAGGSINELRMAYTAGEPASLRMCLELIGKETGSIWLAGRSAELEALSAELAGQLRQEPRRIPVDVREGSSETVASLVSLAGAARHALRLPGAARAVCVPARDPAPPLWERVTVWWLAAACILTLMVGMLEISLATGARTRERVQQIKQLEQRVASKHQELDELAKKQAFLEQQLPHRQALILGLLDALAGTVSEEVVIDRLKETDLEEIDVGGWSLSEKAVQRFAQDLTVSVKPLGLAVTDLNVRTQTGRLGLPGYAFTLRLVPTAISTNSR